MRLPPPCKTNGPPLRLHGPRGRMVPGYQSSQGADGATTNSSPGTCWDTAHRQSQARSYWSPLSLVLLHDQTRSGWRKVTARGCFVNPKVQMLAPEEWTVEPRCQDPRAGVNKRCRPQRPRASTDAQARIAFPTGRITSHRAEPCPGEVHLRALPCCIDVVRQIPRGRLVDLFGCLQTGIRVRESSRQQSASRICTANTPPTHSHGS